MSVVLFDNDFTTFYRTLLKQFRYEICGRIFRWFYREQKQILFDAFRGLVRNDCSKTNHKVDLIISRDKGVSSQYFIDVHYS